MSFLKAHLFLLGCGLVVILAVGACFWPIGTWQTDLQTRMEEQYQNSDRARRLMQASVKLHTVEPLRGPVVQAHIDAKTKEQRNMSQQADKIGQEAAKANRIERIDKGVPLLGGVAQPHYLPKIDANYSARDFMDHYEDLLNTRWLKELKAAMPPTQEDVKTALDLRQAQILQAAPRAANGQLLDPSAGQMSEPEKARFKRNLVVQRAQAALIYADLSAFQRRAWAGGSTAPNEEQIFQAFIDCCVMQDLVNAVKAANAGSRSVETAPIKRLGPINIGANVATALPTTPGATGAPTVSDREPLFLAQLGAAPALPADTAAPAPGRSPVDVTKSMTGRIGGSKFDVTHVRLLVYLDPSYLNQFFQDIYKQNKSYTVLNVKIEAADPFDAASDGFLYGRTPVVKADILLEAVFYRDWTLPLMPEAVKTALGIAPPPK